MPTFIVTTLGCKVNQYESEAISTFLKQQGWKQADGEEADVCIVNTCTVTGKASMQSRQAIRHIIRSNPHARIIVTGCYAQTGAEEIKKIKGVHEIVGHDDKHKIPKALINNDDISLYPAFPECSQCNATTFQQLPVTVCETRSRPFLKIQDGCNAFCTYCIVPYTRGRSRSMPVDEVLRQLSALSEAGYHEVVLTGIHMGCYGLDLAPKTSFTALLKRIAGEKVIDRVRLSSIEPRELTNELIQLVADSDCFCNHFHIPLQSGDDHILKRMHRPYDVQWFRDRIQTIHRKIPDAAIGIDTLIGFPGETEAAFENTRSLLDSLPIAYLHVFPFSPRKGTPAFDYPDSVPADVIKQRCSIMRGLGKQKKTDFYHKQTDRYAQVLIEGKRDQASRMLKGVTSNYIRVLVDEPEQLNNILVNNALIDVRLKEGPASDALLGIPAN